MILSHDITVDAPLEAVFDALVDPAVTATVSGITLGARTHDGLFPADIDLPVASGGVRFSGVARVRDADREAGAIALELSGHDTGGAAPGRGSVALRLRSAGRSTTVSLLLEVDTGGGGDGDGDGDGDGEVERAMAALLDRLGEAVRTAVAGGHGSPAPASDDPVSYGTPWPTARPAGPESASGDLGEPGDEEGALDPDGSDEESSWQATEEELRGLAELVAQLELEDEVAAQAAAPEIRPSPETPEIDVPDVPPVERAPERAPEHLSQEPAPEAPTAVRVAAAAAAATADPVTPVPARYATPGAPVPGTVRIVTDGPLDAAHLGVDGSAAARVRATAEERPWLAPALILGTAAIVLVLRRRRPR